MRLNVVLTLVLAVVLGLWAYDHQSHRADTAEALASGLGDQVKRQDELLAKWEQQAARLDGLDKQLRLAGQALAKQAAAAQRGIEELKANDQATADWLRGLVPGALGRLYERPDTTDPLKWRAPAALPLGGVPAARSSGTGQ
jgi:LysB family phage lysis regulatory protein